MCLPAPRAGERFRNVLLADTYAPDRAVGGRIREARIEAARDAFYRGFVAEAVDSFFARTGC